MEILRRTLLALALPAAACVPTLDDRSSIVEAPRVLAVQASPAEAAPGSTVRYQALWADPTAATHEPAIDWAFCNDPVSLAEIQPVSPRCRAVSADWIAPFGDGNAASGTVPADACRRFGPTPPDPKAGQPTPRPIDPDASGGYYQPLRLLVDAGANPGYVLYRSRVTCGLPGASREQLSEYNSRSIANTNPAPTTLSADLAGGTVTLSPDPSSPPATVAPGQSVTLRLAWPECAETDGPYPVCTGAERYLLFDATRQTLTEARETIAVSWFATAGRFDNDRTAGAAAAAETVNRWTAPATATEVRLWVVLRDDRGGAGWQSYQLRVAP